jgi:hypothetical protein
MRQYINFIDNDKLTISFSALIFNVESINAKFGDLSTFVEKFDLYGKTNGKLYILIEMNEPPYHLYELIDVKLASFNFKEKVDYIIASEQLVYGVRNTITPLINKPIPECEDVQWLGSKICFDGNFVWFESNNYYN